MEITQGIDGRHEWDAVVIGGGAAGSSAALMLVRARRSVLMVDAGQPRNAVAAHMHGVLGHDGKPPRQLLAEGRREIEGYGGVVVDGRVERVAALDDPDGPRFRLTLDGGAAVTARRVILATGLADVLPEVPGLAAHWGAGVVVCPYCDGYEVRDRRIGVLATGPGSLHHVQMLRQWSADVTFLVAGGTADGAPLEIDAVSRAGIDARGIRVEESAVVRVLGERGALEGVELADGRTLPLDALFAMPGVAPRDGIARALGAATEDTPWGPFVAADPMGQTSVPGLLIAGNASSGSANVPVAMAAGTMAGAMANAGMVTEDVAMAVALADAPTPAVGR
ncbi:NAD(P)/FAD-dependent oxidoreductase [Clavibacter michiganensis subsp. michiganensis]|uniref:NAD(P)/FAD-dependent oxidoreductase n=1 Tax=Clavibacter michiganensis TaxID=28447 RepID=UPI000B6BA543|nr:NAD(P)/FAD-dependent oxidoreductase [Clavibacter michiganensis]MWJ17048.1 NAD(P)/FAD-dependent oxidoreductase [Clavibacter michiganensis subsp. michiganensis]MWJ18992.1 NAD(P)/FAD-dependent oxidoreductase [Clavibacter michiganensis subsp. michiganensis]OUD98525.1 Thioredoxin reductase [Clavibacter michiganensis subsp. michiganensis]OUE03100.1 Thioredoxin reductase [Clavibacter michiganensis subsp. michiganensis]